MDEASPSPLHFSFVKDLGIGNFGIAKLLRHKLSGALVAAKYIERGAKIDKNVEREIINHHRLSHPNIVHFIEVLVTPTHLCILMEFAAGGEIFDQVCAKGRFCEDEARYFFQQLISGVSYCHAQGIYHRDLKLENTLLDGNKQAPRLKLCDFGYSKSCMDSQPKSTVGTPAYIAPEVLQRKEYSGQAADVWSCGVTLYVMLVGSYPFEDPRDPKNFKKTVKKITTAEYTIPQGLPLSAACLDLISKIFVVDPKLRISMDRIKQHPWFVKNLPRELMDCTLQQGPRSAQSLEEIKLIIQNARIVPSLPKSPLLSKLLGMPAPPPSSNFTQAAVGAASPIALSPFTPPSAPRQQAFNGQQMLPPFQTNAFPPQQQQRQQQQPPASLPFAMPFQNGMQQPIYTGQPIASDMPQQPYAAQPHGFGSVLPACRSSEIKDSMEGDVQVGQA